MSEIGNKEQRTGRDNFLIPSVSSYKLPFYWVINSCTFYVWHL